MYSRNVLKIKSRARTEPTGSSSSMRKHIHQEMTSDAEWKVLQRQENMENNSRHRDSVCGLNAFVISHICVLLWKAKRWGWRAGQPMFIAAEVEINAFILSARLLIFWVCRDGHMASDLVPYMHEEPFNYVYVHAWVFFFFFFGTGERTLSVCHVVAAGCSGHSGEDRWIEFSFSVVYNSHRQREEQRAGATEHETERFDHWNGEEKKYTSKKEPHHLKVEKITKKKKSELAKDKCCASNIEWMKERQK